MQKVLMLILVLALAAGSILAGCGSETSYREVTLGALVASTGALASSGASSQAAIEIAMEDINELLDQVNSELRIKLIVKDTGTDPALAPERLKELEAEGVKIIIGPQSSAEVQAVKAYADEKGLLLLSADSTAPSLAIAGDGIFRFALKDTL